MHFFEFWTIIDYVLYVIKLSMKKLFIQLWQLILKHKKKFIYGALVLFISQFCFFNLWWIGVENVVYADDGTTNENSNFQEVATEKLAIAQLLHKLIYFLMYPILIVAWKLVDNSLVYGEVFGFDAVLWQLWVIVRNIANFGLGFIFIFKIFQFLIKWQKWDDIKKLIISTLIAWVGIQASWFIMAALIDVSTIVTYGVWWLPLSVLKEDEDNLKYNPYVLSNVLYVDGNDMNSYHMYLSNSMFLSKDEKSKAKFISQCETFAYKYKAPKAGTDGEGEYEVELIMAPQMVYYKDDKDGIYYPTEKLLCHLGDQVYRFSELYDKGCKWDDKGIEWPSVWANAGEQEWKDAQNDFKISLNNSLEKCKNDELYLNIDDLITDWKILQVGDAHAWSIWEWPLWHQYEEWDKLWLDVNNEWVWKDWNLIRLNDVLSGNYAWVFTALYGSLLNAWSNLRLWATSENSLYVKVLNVFLSLWHVVAIGIPLIVMVIVFMMRIWILWMAIALSPLIILLKSFGFDKSDFMKKWILKHLNIENLIPIIFSPAVVCFAISVSTVLVRIINAMNWDNIETSKLSILWWAITLNIAGMWVNMWKLICSVIWIAITWFLVWAAVESSSLWKTKIVESAKNLATTTLWSVPIVPVPWKDWVSWVWVDAAKRLPSEVTQQIKNTYGNESNETINDIIDPSRVEWRRADAYKRNIINFTPTMWEDWTNKAIPIGPNGSNGSQTFNALPDDKKDAIIQAINGISDKDKRKAFGESAKEIKVWSVIYEFKEGDVYKYEKKVS